MAGVLSQFFTSPDVELHRAAARQAEASHYGHTPHSAARGGGEEAGGETRPWPRGGGPPSVQGVLPSPE